jgi:fibro-slime domain-containing protein
MYFGVSMNPLKTLCFAFSLVALLAASVVAQSRTFYFLPPNDDKWIAGSSYLYDVDEAKATLMQIDTAKCGWSKMAFSSTASIPEKVMIYLGPQGRDKLDANGRGADISDQAWIPLKAKFGTSTLLYLTADDMQFSNTSPAGTSNEELANRCTYKMAAFIYDTDNSVNPSFSGAYIVPSAGNNGIRRGIVAPTLDTATRKPTFVANPGYANWINAESFVAAFTPKGIYNGNISNIPRCYDMPFGRATNGAWEFDSDKMRTPTGNNLVGGFYPYILDSLYSRDEDGTIADYTDCPTCNKEYRADCFFTMNNTSLNNVSALTYKGTTYRGIDAFSRAYLDNGWNNTTPYNVYNTTSYGCTYPSPGYDGTAKARANLSFCFESHAKFIYEKGQEFFFRGDDDIWVFINNRLVIDLGGIHIAAPGFVDLDSIGRNWDAQGNPIEGRAATKDTLIEGEVYPIDIFVCERMGVQSNVRISTNIHTMQKKSTFYSIPEKPEQSMCVTENSGNNCAERLNNPTGNKLSRYCGSDLIDKGYKVQFYMFASGNTKDTIWLDPTKNSKSCTGTANNWICYRGIKGVNAVYSCGDMGQCKGNVIATEKVVDLQGNYNIYARLENSTNVVVGIPIVIDNIESARIASNTRIIWGSATPWPSYNNPNPQPKELKDSYGNITTKEQSIIAGRRTPIYISSGSWDDEPNYTSFSYDDDPSNTAGFTVTIAGGIGLKIYESETGGTGATRYTGNLVNGMAILWVEGAYDIGNKTFKLNVTTEWDAPGLTINVYQPELKIIPTQNLVGNITARAKANSILLENVPAGAKVELYNLQGKRIYSAYPENPKILRNKDNRHLEKHSNEGFSTTLVIGVQTKGIYILKINNNILRIPVM